MKALHSISYVLLWVGGLNWGIFGITGWDVGQLFPGGMEGMVARVIYVLVGLAALYTLFTHKSYCKHCGDRTAMM